jgi:Predicted transcriptional regulators
MSEATAREMVNGMATNEVKDNSDMNRVTIGEKIIRYRKVNGMSQTHLASKIGISTQGLLKIEKGHTYPRADTVQKILNALCITPNQLFGKEDLPEEHLDLLTRIRRMSE